MSILEAGPVLKTCKIKVDRRKVRPPNELELTLSREYSEYSSGIHTYIIHFGGLHIKNITGTKEEAEEEYKIIKPIIEQGKYNIKYETGRLSPMEIKLEDFE